MNIRKTDVLIIGSGIAGLVSAIKLSEAFPRNRITVVTKNKDESNTQLAQGGIAVVTDFQLDSFQKHVSDTLCAGDGNCNRSVVEMVVAEAPERLKELMSWGVNFDKNSADELSLGLEGGHSVHRVVHVKDQTGLHIAQILQRKAAQMPNLELCSNHFAIDLITNEHMDKNAGICQEQLKCFGAQVLDEERGCIETFISKVTILATGGAGQAYRVTTNPKIATGDGVAMAHRAKAIIKDMAFVQFHPTAFYSSNENSSFLISEAVRGYGAHLVNHNDERFVFKYDARGELASRDIVAMAIDDELKKSNRHFAFLDCRHLDQIDFKNKFPSIYSSCMLRGLNPEHDLIPVAPSAHYFCGGVEVDQSGRASVENLYACGECACTGMHGANRLASNSLLEALVYAHHCAKDILQNFDCLSFPTFIPKVLPKRSCGMTNEQKINSLKIELNNLMSNHVAIVRSNQGLFLALSRLSVMQKEIEKWYHSGVISVSLLEIRNLLAVALLTVKQSLSQKQNCGSFYNIDLLMSPSKRSSFWNSTP